MPTIRWADVDCTHAPGEFVVRDMRVSIRAEQIESWKDDPDGRFALAVVSQAGATKTAELQRFYPSL